LRQEINVFQERIKNIEAGQALECNKVQSWIENPEYVTIYWKP
jgi:hypothetical protein